MPNTSSFLTTSELHSGTRGALTGFAGRALLALSATGFIAACAHLSIPLYFTPIPVTLQTFAVLAVGLLFEPSLAASTLLLYLVEGASGLPVFSPTGPGGIAQILGPTGGFLLSYPLAAALAGYVLRALRSRLSNFSAAVMACTVSTIVIFLVAAPWTARWLHLSLASAWNIAVTPFLPGEGLKIGAASLIFTTYSRWRRS